MLFHAFLVCIVCKLSYVEEIKNIYLSIQLLKGPIENVGGLSTCAKLCKVPIILLILL